MCGFGAQVLGYNHPEVEAAVAAQAALGTTLTGPTERSIELAERLVGLRPGAEWVILAKNGTDVTSAAKLAARAGTGKKLILREAANPKGFAAPYWAYHGAHSWMRGANGVLPEVSSDFEVPYTYNDLGSVKAALQSADGDCAAIFVGGASYPYSAETEMATPEFAQGLRKLADEYGVMLVLDEIRTNFRVGPSVRGHWAALGAAGSDGSDVAPDMQCICKAVANGHPLAALVGNERARDGASIITASGTFWLSGGPMAAALKTIDILEADDSAAMGHMQAMGSMLTDGCETY
jgi:glutamate-1-semialdehyde 2,1-aminomutase